MLVQVSPGATIAMSGSEESDAASGIWMRTRPLPPTAGTSARESSVTP